MISVLSNSLSLKYQKFTQAGCKDIVIRNFDFVTKTQFLYRIEMISSLKLTLFMRTKYSGNSQITQKNILTIFCREGIKGKFPKTPCFTHFFIPVGKARFCDLNIILGLCQLIRLVSVLRCIFLR